MKSLKLLRVKKFFEGFKNCVMKRIWKFNSIKANLKSLFPVYWYSESKLFWIIQLIIIWINPNDSFPRDVGQFFLQLLLPLICIGKMPKNCARRFYRYKHRTNTRTNHSERKEKLHFDDQNKHVIFFFSRKNFKKE